MTPPKPSTAATSSPAAVSSVAIRCRIAVSSTPRKPLISRPPRASLACVGAARSSCTHWSGVTVTEKTQLKSSEIAATENSDAQYSPAFSVEAAIG